MSERIDVLLVEKELVKSREKARAMIMAGVVYANGTRVEKAGTMVAEDAALEVREDPVPFVSRGGYKLEKREPGERQGGLREHHDKRTAQRKHGRAQGDGADKVR